MTYASPVQPERDDDDQQLQFTDTDDLPNPANETSEFPIQDTPVERKQEPQRSPVWEVVETLLLAVLIFLLVRTFVLNFRVDGASMDPTLRSGEMMLVNRQAYTHFDLYGLVNWLPFVETDNEHIFYPFHPPQRGDIIVLHPPVDGGKPYIKRVIGLPGERLAIRDGRVWINGEPLNETYLGGISTVWQGQIGNQEITLRDDEVFVMGDNRGNSSDSRMFGPITIDRIIGKAWISYWPRDKFGVMRTPSYTE